MRGIGKHRGRRVLAWNEALLRLGKAEDHRRPRYSKWGPGIRTITIRLVGNEESQAAAHTY